MKLFNWLFPPKEKEKEIEFDTNLLYKRAFDDVFEAAIPTFYLEKTNPKSRFEYALILRPSECAKLFRAEVTILQISNVQNYLIAEVIDTTDIDQKSEILSENQKAAMNEVISFTKKTLAEKVDASKLDINKYRGFGGDTIG